MFRDRRQLLRKLTTEHTCFWAFLEMKSYFFAVLLLQYLVPSKQDGGSLTWREILPEPCGYSGMQLRRHLGEKMEVTTTEASDTVPNRIPNPASRISDHPWQVALMDNNTREFWCVGSIISKYHVLTASHCFPTPEKAKSSILVVFGTAILDERTMSFPIKELYLHKHYKAEHHRNNIALLRVDGEFKWSTAVFPICLPSIDESYASGRECVISGFGDVIHGQSNDRGVLKYGVVNLSTEMSCKRYNERKLGNITGGMFCASYNEDRIRSIDACTGDSGGPLQCQDGDRRHLLGINSFGYKCGLKLYPGIYTKVVKYLPWIYDRVELSMGYGNLSLANLPDGDDVGGPS